MRHHDLFCELRIFCAPGSVLQAPLHLKKKSVSGSSSPLGAPRRVKWFPGMPGWYLQAVVYSEMGLSYLRCLFSGFLAAAVFE